MRRWERLNPRCDRQRCSLGVDRSEELVCESAAQGEGVDRRRWGGYRQERAW